MGDALRLIDECSREVGGCVEGGRAVILISEPRRWEPPGVGMGWAGHHLGGVLALLKLIIATV